MQQEIKDEALEQIILDIQFGFENEEVIVEGILDMFYNEQGFDQDWLKQTVQEKYREHLQLSTNWTKPTDFDRLAASFDELIKQKIVCLHKAGYTKQDAIGDCEEAIEQLKEHGVEAIGYCYYHAQDLARAVHPESKNLLLGFDSANEDDTGALVVGQKIVEVLSKNGLEIIWSGSIEQRIEIINLNWQKVPDNEDWSIERVKQLLVKPDNQKKPFWKFW